MLSVVRGAPLNHCRQSANSRRWRHRRKNGATGRMERNTVGHKVGHIWVILLNHVESQFILHCLIPLQILQYIILIYVDDV